MEYKIITSEDEFYSMREVWDTTLQQSIYNRLFMTHEWLWSWWENNRGNNRLFIVVVYDGDKIKAIAPLMIKGRNSRKIQFIGHDMSDYMDFIIAGAQSECFFAIWDALQEHSGEWDWMEFIYLAADSPNFPLWRDLAGPQGRYRACLTYDSPAVVLDMKRTGGSWSAYEKYLPARRKNDMKRCDRRISEIGQAEYRIFSDPLALQKNAVDCIEYHKKRWLGKGSASQFNDNKLVRQYASMAEHLSRNKWIELALLQVNGATLAFAFGFIYTGRYYYYTPSFNPDYAKYSPGNLLLRFLIERAYRENMNYFDLLRGAEPYKYNWAKDEIALYRIKIFNNSLKGKALWHGSHLKRLVYSLLKNINIARRIKKGMDLVKAKYGLYQFNS